MFYSQFPEKKFLNQSLGDVLFFFCFIAKVCNTVSWLIMQQLLPGYKGAP